jgi:hypothetical protein
MFIVDRNPIQRGRGLGGLFASLFRKLIPFGKTFAKGALNAGKDFVKSDLGKDIIKDTISSSAQAATDILINSDATAAKEAIRKTLKRSGDKSTKVAKRIAKEKLDKLLTGQGKRKLENKMKKYKNSSNMKTIFDSDSDSDSDSDI